MSRNKKRLGKGLEAILGPVPADRDRIRQLHVADLRPNPHQPRRTFADESLQELAASIRTHGVVQPLLVVPAGEGYVLVAGERRWRAARVAGLEHVPALVQELDPAQMTEVAVIENLQREDLTPIEEARAYQTLQEEFGLAQHDIARRVGRSRPQVANMLRLLTLHEEVQDLVDAGRLSVGHAKVLLSLARPEDQRRLARAAAEESWTVRRLQERAGGGAARKPRRAARGSSREPEPHWRAAAEELQRLLGTRVEVKAGGGRRGRIVMEFYSPEEFERLYAILRSTTAEHGA